MYVIHNSWLDWFAKKKQVWAIEREGLCCRPMDLFRTSHQLHSSLLDDQAEF